MPNHNHLSNIAIVGASGTLGTHITRSLLATRHHIITALTRTNSPSTFPPGVLVQRIDYSSHSSLVTALRGQDALVITLSGHADIKTTEEALVRAAAEAGVRWVLPNEWSPDTADPELVRDIAVFAPKVATRDLITSLGEPSYISLATGFWYAHALSNPMALGLDIPNRTATLFDRGTTPISVSTLSQIGRAVAAILSLPIQPTKEGELTLKDLAGKVSYASSFTLTQREMLDSVCRVTETSASDWKVAYEDVKERYEAGVAEVARGEWGGWAKVMYGRVFFADGRGDFEGREGTLNAVLRLRVEDLDEATQEAVEMAESRSSGRG